eukprot:5764960-Pyramimonas_sp.AAC.1
MRNCSREPSPVSPAGGLAINASAVRAAVASEPISQTISTSTCKVRRKSENCTEISWPPTCTTA